MRLTQAKKVPLQEWLDQYIRLMKKVRDGEEMTETDWELPELLTGRPKALCDTA